MRATTLTAVLALALAAACGGGSHGTTDGARAGDGSGSGASDAATGDAGALQATPGTWTFFPQADTTCGDGSPAGLAVNPATTASTDLTVYFEGGGACWDAVTCFEIQSAIRIDQPYDEAAFESELPELEMLAFFDRTGATPFAASHFAYVPYCTGDVHAGTAVTTYTVQGAPKTVHHTGGTNAAAFARTLHATFPGVTRVWVLGSSAGGYATTLDLGAFADAFPGAEIHALQDSGLFVPVLANYATMQQSWGVTFPASFSTVMDEVTTAHPASRIGLLTFDNDATLEAFLGYSSGQLAPAIDTLVTDHYDHATTHVFEVSGSSHTMLAAYATTQSNGGVVLADWIAQWATGSAAWADAR